MTRKPLVPSGEWKKHFRRYGKKVYHKKVRAAAKRGL